MSEPHVEEHALGAELRRDLARIQLLVGFREFEPEVIGQGDDVDGLVDVIAVLPATTPDDFHPTSMPGGTGSAAETTKPR